MVVGKGRSLDADRDRPDTVQCDGTHAHPKSGLRIVEFVLRHAAARAESDGDVLGSSGANGEPDACETANEEAEVCGRERHGFMGQVKGGSQRRYLNLGCFSA
jgi:hypothetical protein